MQTSASRGLRVDPRLFGERYSEFEEDGCGGSSGATLSNIQPGDLVNLPDVYAAICRGIVHNLVGMVPPEVTNPNLCLFIIQYCVSRVIFCVQFANPHAVIF